MFNTRSQEPSLCRLTNFFASRFQDAVIHCEDFAAAHAPQVPHPILNCNAIVLRLLAVH